MSEPVAIVGGGLAGLACGIALDKAGVRFRLLKSSSRVGGRVQTDEVEGFRLDRGFQVLLEAYPECQRVLDYEALDLRPFRPGALVRGKNRFHRLADPWREPAAAVAALAADVGTFKDKLLIGRLRHRLSRTSLDEIWSAPETTILERMRQEGFSDGMIDGFLRPLFAGITLDATLSNSSRVFEFVFKMMALGPTSLPARGIGAITEQLAARLPAGSIETKRRVRAVEAGRVVLDESSALRASAVVVATEGPEAARLMEGIESPGSRGVLCLYFAARALPIDDPILVLDGTGSGPVTNLCVPSRVAPSLAPPGEVLVSATVLETGRTGDDDRLVGAVLAQLEEWFGHWVATWRHLRTYRIAHAQPHQPPGFLEPSQRSVTSDAGVYVCGDHRDDASINGALVSGRRAAESVIRSLSRSEGR